MNKEYLKFAVAGVNNGFWQRDGSCDRCRIAYGAENIITLTCEFAHVKLQMMSLDLWQILHGVEQVRRVPEHVLKVLRRRVRQPGERAERCNIGKILISELADVDLFGLSGNYVLCGLEHVGGYAVAGCKIVCAAGWNISERSAAVAADNAGYDLVERTVAADADDQVKLIAVKLRKLRCVAAFAGRKNRHSIVAFGKNSYYIGQKTQGSAPPRNRIYNKQRE